MNKRYLVECDKEGTWKLNGRPYDSPEAISRRIVKQIPLNTRGKAYVSLAKNLNQRYEWALKMQGTSAIHGYPRPFHFKVKYEVLSVARASIFDRVKEWFSNIGRRTPRDT